MGLVQHAEDELKRAGLFDSDSDYGGLLGKSVLDLVKAFAGQGHSGGSAEQALEIFLLLVKGRNLTPLTSDPSEWSDESYRSGYPFWQNKRRYSTFSRDGGKTWYDLDDPSFNNGDSLEQARDALKESR